MLRCAHEGYDTKNAQQKQSIDQDHSLREASPFALSIIVLLGFYGGLLCTDPQARAVNAVRSYALRHLPYEPHDAVDVLGTKRETFASQLDYVVLKLALTPSKRLCEEVRAQIKG